MLEYQEIASLTTTLLDCLPGIVSEWGEFDPVVTLVQLAVSSGEIGLLRAAAAAVVARSCGNVSSCIGIPKTRKKLVPLDEAYRTLNIAGTQVAETVVGIKGGLFSHLGSPMARYEDSGDGEWRFTGIEGLISLPGAADKLELALLGYKHW